MRKVSTLIVITIMLALATAGVPAWSQPVAAGQAQTTEKKDGTGAPAPAVKESGSHRRAPARRNKRDVEQQRAPAQQQTAPPQPVVVVNQPQPEYLSGEANVTVNPKQPTVIKIALAQNATSIVELPADDFIYYTHEGNPQLVAIFDSPTKETDHFITLMPGTGFVGAPAGGRGPNATISLQMESGLVITLIVIPVADVMLNAHRVVINYKRDEVITARRAAGLAVNLDGRERPQARPKATSTRFGKSSGDETNDRTDTPRIQAVADVESAKADGKKPKKSSKPPDLAAASNRALIEAGKSSKAFTKWSAPTQGMALSLAPAVDLDDHSRLVLVAVKNQSDSEIRLVPGNPEVFVQWFDEKGTPLNITELKKLHVETTAIGGRVPAGQVAYYAIVYETPILGASQKVRVSVAQITASDQPASADVRTP